LRRIRNRLSRASQSHWKSPHQLHKLGMRTIGPALDAPRDGMPEHSARRPGSYFGRLAPDPREQFKLPFIYAARFELRVSSWDSYIAKPSPPN